MALLGKRLGIGRELALVLCSVVLDLKISQMVNAPLTTISAYLPEAIFD
jgi:acetamidase/formamidase